MAELSGGDLVARVLAQAGVSHVFTLCGGHILPIYDGCLREGIRVIDLRHEQAAAHAADAWARLTRNLGVAIVTAGPGVTDAVTGVANAYSARSPVLLIGGAAPLGLRGLGALQEMEQVALLRPITKGSWSVAETRQIPETLTTAIRAALSARPGPVFVEIPVDLLLTQVEDRLAPWPTATGCCASSSTRCRRGSPNAGGPGARPSARARPRGGASSPASRRPTTCRSPTIGSPRRSPVSSRRRRSWWAMAATSSAARPSTCPCTGPGSGSIRAPSAASASVRRSRSPPSS